MKINLLNSLNKYLAVSLMTGIGCMSTASPSTSAYVIERADGTLSSYNCTAKNLGATIATIAAEDVVSRVHLNLKKKQSVKVTFGSGETVFDFYSGMKWIGPGGIPEDLRN